MSQGTILGKGGSNYYYWHFDAADKKTYEPYGALKTYHLTDYTYNGKNYNPRDIVNNQLLTMFQNGQHRLRLPIYFYRDEYTDFPKNGVPVVDPTPTSVSFCSKGNDLVQQAKDNIKDLLNTIKTIGYEQIIVSFHPLWHNSFDYWNTQGQGWNAEIDSYLNENFAVIKIVREIVAASGIPYLLDLTNEGATTDTRFYGLNNSKNSRSSEYFVRLWNLYNSAFGKVDTLGFSVIGDGSVADRIKNAYKLYDQTFYGQPNHWDLHIYDYQTAYFKKAHSQLKSFKITGPVILGETYYNDTLAAKNFADVIRSTGRSVEFLLEWPLSWPLPNTNWHEPPFDFTEFHNQGF